MDYRWYACEGGGSTGGTAASSTGSGPAPDAYYDRCRLDIYANFEANYVQISDLRLYDDADQVIVLTGAIGTPEAPNSHEGPDAATDGDPSTKWLTDFQGRRRRRLDRRKGQARPAVRRAARKLRCGISP